MSKAEVAAFFDYEYGNPLRMDPVLSRAISVLFWEPFR
jgi:hypothetical protein